MVKLWLTELSLYDWKSFWIPNSSLYPQKVNQSISSMEREVIYVWSFWVNIFNKRYYYFIWGAWKNSPIWPTINIQANDVLKNHSNHNWKSLQVTSFTLRWEQRCYWMRCPGSFCLADLTVDEKSVTAVAVHGTKLALSILYNTHTSARFALFPEAFYSRVSKPRGEKKCQLEVKNKAVRKYTLIDSSPLLC